MNTQKLPCLLSDEEVRHRANQLAAALKERDDEALQGKAEAAERKAHLKAIDTKVIELGKQVLYRQEERDVVVTEEKDWAVFAISTIRTDTAEVIAVRAMLPEERKGQVRFRFKEDENAANEDPLVVDEPSDESAS